MGKPPKTAEGNPFRLTRRQHVLPKKSIGRFCDADGNVEVLWKDGGNTFLARPGNPVFCADRVWSQKAEVGWMKDIEDEFQLVAEKVLGGEDFSDLVYQNAINMFWSLWVQRQNVRDAEAFYVGEELIDRVSIDADALFNAQERDELEVQGFATIEQCGIPSRYLFSSTIGQNTRDQFNAMRSYRWGAVIASGVNFLVPDHVSHQCYVPISASVALVAGVRGFSAVSSEAVASLNHQFLSQAKNYCFSRRIDECGML